MDTAFVAADVVTALPEIMLAVGAMAFLMFGVFRGEHTAETINWLCIGLLLFAALVVLTISPVNATAFGGSFIVDEFSRFMKVLTLAASAVAIVMSDRFMKAE